MKNAFTAFTDGAFDRKVAKDFPVRDRQIVEIDADAQISDAFGTLLTHNLLCAPVWDSQQSGYLGFFDVNDALSISSDIDLLSQASGVERSRNQLKTSDVKVLDIFNPANLIRSCEVPWVAVGPMTRMEEVVHVLAKLKARRVPVVDPHSKRVIKIISQADICRQLHQILRSTRESDWSPIFTKCPLDLGLGLHSEVCVIAASQEAREAFRLMIDLNISCVGVVEDESNKLIACIANKDIHLVTKPSATAGKTGMPAARTNRRFSIATSVMGDRDYFGMTAHTFANEVRNAEVAKRGRSSNAVAMVQTTSPTTPLHEILALFAQSGQHRVFLVNDLGQAVGIISEADICLLVWEEMERENGVGTGPPPTLPPPRPVRQKKESAGE